MRSRLLVYVLAFCLTSNALAGEARPPGVSWRIVFNVTPLYPRSFEISATGPRSFSAAKLREAWEKKAQMVVHGRRYKASPFVIHDNETDFQMAWPYRTRSITATITPLD